MKKVWLIALGQIYIDIPFVPFNNQVATDTTYRFLLTVKDGSLFDTSEVVVVQKAKVASPGEAWDRSKTYASPCHRVSWNGDEWDNQWWTSGNEPGADGTWGVWRKVGSTNNQCN